MNTEPVTTLALLYHVRTEGLRSLHLKRKPIMVIIEYFV